MTSLLLIMLVNQGADTVQLVGHLTLIPSVLAVVGITVLGLKETPSLRKEYLMSLVISCVVSQASLIHSDHLMLSLAARFSECHSIAVCAQGKEVC